MIPITSQVVRWLCAISLLTLPAPASAETEDHPADIAALEAAVREARRDGDAAWEPMYLEVTPDKLKAGWNQISVTVTDLNSGQAVSQSAIFQLEPGRNATQVEPIKAESGQE